MGGRHQYLPLDNMVLWVAGARTCQSVVVNTVRLTCSPPPSLNFSTGMSLLHYKVNTMTANKFGRLNRLGKTCTFPSLIDRTLRMKRKINANQNFHCRCSNIVSNMAGPSIIVTARSQTTNTFDIPLPSLVSAKHFQHLLECQGQKALKLEATNQYR